MAARRGEGGHGQANWAGNVRWTPAEVVRPSSVQSLRELLARAAAAGQVVRPAGSRHSFTPLAATDGISLDLGALSGVRRIDDDVVTVGAGTPLHRLNRQLDGLDRALANLGDIDRQTIMGAISTGTHGTGARFAGLAAQVAAFTLVTAAGEQVHCSPQARTRSSSRRPWSAWGRSGSSPRSRCARCPRSTWPPVLGRRPAPR